MKKYLVVLGAVMSSLGKGISASSIGVLMKGLGLTVSPIKIDPYLNCDAGTMSPFQHGEVFVLDDGSEVDLDLGNYERFLDVSLTGDNSITTGKIYKSVIDNERRGSYLGQTVQVVPHITDEIENRIRKGANNADVCIIELGGTIGDIESLPFLFALKNLSLRPDEMVSFALVSYVPIAGSEQKTKPTQHGIQALHHHGIWPDMIICRCDEEISGDTREKISKMCHIPSESVISCHNVFPIQKVPLLFYIQGLPEIIVRNLKLDSVVPFPMHSAINYWAARADDIVTVSLSNEVKEITVAIIGKYTGKNDTYLSVTKALLHAGSKCKVRVKIEYASHLNQLNEIRIDGIIIPGGFGDRGIEDKIASILQARKCKIPILGICLGLQAMIIAAARSKLRWKDADSTEFNPDTSHPVIDVMPGYDGVEQKGSSMRLGSAQIIIYDQNLKRWYQECAPGLFETELSQDVIVVKERHRHRYELNHKKYGNDLEYDANIRILAFDSSNTRVEAIRWLGSDDSYFCYGFQYHPEFMSHPGRCSGPFLGFVKSML